MTSRGTSYGACAIGNGTYDVRPRDEEYDVTEESAVAEELVHYHVDDQVAAITFDSQHNRNALSKQLVTEPERLDCAGADDDVKVVLLRAEGRRSAPARTSPRRAARAWRGRRGSWSTSSAGSPPCPSRS